MPRGVYARKPMPPETRAKISATTKGIPKSAETRARISAAKMGHAPTIGQWKGEDIGYSGVHYRLEAALPKRCEEADDSCKGILEACLRHNAPIEFICDDDERGRYFVGEPTDGYVRLCRSHHRRYDRRHRLT